MVIKTAKAGQRPRVYGNDYPTRDGTCIRDYIHVLDLCSAHEMGIQRLMKQDIANFEIFNLGTKSGTSVKEITEEIRKYINFEIDEAPRREGDPAVLIADSAKALKILGWQPSKTISEIIKDAVHFHTTAESSLRKI